MLIFQPTGWWGRDNFGNFLNDRGLLGNAVEIGTHRGVFAAALVQQWKGGVLFCVDPYLPNYDSEDPASSKNREQDLVVAKALLKPYPGRSAFLQLSSCDAVLTFTNESLDFVYLDGCHRYLSVFQDIRLWWPKLRKGGILAGHDIVYTGEDNGGWGRFVQQAVLEFAMPLKETVWLVREVDNAPWSWFIEKR